MCFCDGVCENSLGDPFAEKLILKNGVLKTSLRKMRLLKIVSGKCAC